MGIFKKNRCEQFHSSNPIFWSESLLLWQLSVATKLHSPTASLKVFFSFPVLLNLQSTWPSFWCSKSSVDLEQIGLFPRKFTYLAERTAKIQRGFMKLWGKIPGLYLWNIIMHVLGPIAVAVHKKALWPWVWREERVMFKWVSHRCCYSQSAFQELVGQWYR